MASRSLVVGGIRMRWEEEGDGTPVVLLHGIPTSPALWRLVIPLVRDARCLAWELVGYGHSMKEGEGRDLSLAAQTDYLLQWMDAIGLEHPVLVGHGIGGGIAQRVAVLQPQRVSGLVLCNSVAYRSWPIGTLRAITASSGAIARMPEGALRELLRMLFRRAHDERAVARGCLDVHFEPYAHPGGAEAFVRQVRSLRTEDTAEVGELLSRLDVPARLVWGVHDSFTRMSAAKQLARDLAAPLERIPDGRHFAPEDHPERVAAAIHAIMEEVAFRGPEATARVQPLGMEAVVTY